MLSRTLISSLLCGLLIGMAHAAPDSHSTEAQLTKSLQAIKNSRLDTDAYLRHYSRNFSSDSADYAVWVKQKQPVQLHEKAPVLDQTKQPLADRLRRSRIA